MAPLQSSTNRVTIDCAVIECRLRKQIRLRFRPADRTTLKKLHIAFCCLVYFAGSRYVTKRKSPQEVTAYSSIIWRCVPAAFDIDMYSGGSNPARSVTIMSSHSSSSSSSSGISLPDRVVVGGAGDHGVG